MSTSPLPPPEPSFNREHAALQADLADTLDLQAGLDRILGPARYHAEGPPTISGRSRADVVRYQVEHDDLVTDLAATLRLNAGVADILSTTSAHAGLLTDVAAALRTEDGLARILASRPAPLPEPPIHEGATEHPASPSLRGSQPDGAHQLAVIRALPGHQRLLLRTGDRHRELRRVMHALEDLDAALASTPHGTDRRAADLCNALQQQRQHLDAAVTALAGSVPASAQRMTIFDQSARVFSATLAIAPDGTWLATAGDDGVVRVWDAATGVLRIELTGHAGGVRVLAIAPDGTWLATAGDDGVVRVWDATTGRVRTELTGHAGGVRVLAIAPHGTWLATAGDDGVVRVWDAAIGVRAWEGRHTSVNAVAIAPDYTWLATAGDDGVVRVWDTVTGVLRIELTGHAGGVRVLAIAPDGTWLATAGDDGVVRVWDAATCVLRAWLGGHTSVNAVAIAPDCSWLATAGDDGVVRVWDIATGVLRIELTGHAGGVRVLAIAPDGTWLATAGDDSVVRVWDATTGRVRTELTGHAGGVRVLAIAPDGRLVTASDVGVVWMSGDARLRHYMLRDTGRSDLDDATSSFRHLTDQLHRTEDLLRSLSGTGLQAGVRAACRHLVAAMSEQAEELWVALSEFQGVDLHAAPETNIEDLEGVLWSDATAKAGPTIWPHQLRLMIERHSRPADADAGVFIVQFGTVIGASVDGV